MHDQSNPPSPTPATQAGIGSTVIPAAKRNNKSAATRTATSVEKSAGKPSAKSAGKATGEGARKSTTNTASAKPAAKRKAKLTPAAQLRAARDRSLLLTRPGFLIRRMHQLHSALFLEATRGFNITPVQYSLMTTLAQHEHLDQKGLSHELGLERTSVAEVILRLQERGLLERYASPTDARVKLVRLTRKGRSLVEKMEPAVEEAHERTISHLPKAEREQFLLQLIRLVEANNDIGNVPFKLQGSDD